MQIIKQSSLDFRVLEKSFPIPPSWRSLDGFLHGIQSETAKLSFATPIFWRMGLLSIQRFVLPHLSSYSPRDRHMMLSSFCVPEETQILGVCFSTKNTKGQWQTRQSFVEDEHGCWCHLQYILDPMGQNIPNSEVYRSALQNHPKPIGLGGWFSTSRWYQLRLYKMNEKAKENV